MEKFKVATEQGVTIITQVEANLKLRVLDAATTTLPGDTPVIEATPTLARVCSAGQAG